MFMIDGGENGGDDKIGDDVDENSDGDYDNDGHDYDDDDNNVNHENDDDKNKESTAATLINGEITARAVRQARLTTGYCHHQTS